MNAIDPAKHPLRIRALFLSDFHFGYKGVDGAALLDCLTSYSPQTIYLIGDIIDGWKLSKRWHWRADYTRVIDALVEHRQRGVKIIYLPGNHDERVRRASTLRRTRFGFRIGIRICNMCVHRLKDGKRIIVMHGDQFDNFLIRGAVSRFGDWFFDYLSDLFGYTKKAPLVMIDGRPRRFSLAKALMKRSGKSALRILNNLERAVWRLVQRKGADGLIFGHTHVPALRKIKDEIVFGNCGMWMGHTNTAIIETLEGVLEQIRWPDMRAEGAPGDESIPASEAVHIARHVETAFVIRKIRQLWPSRHDSQIQGVGTQPFERDIGIINQRRRNVVDISGETAFGDEFTAQA